LRPEERARGEPSTAQFAHQVQLSYLAVQKCNQFDSTTSHNLHLSLPRLPSVSIFELSSLSLSSSYRGQASGHLRPRPSRRRHTCGLYRVRHTASHMASQAPGHTHPKSSNKSVGAPSLMSRNTSLHHTDYLRNEGECRKLARSDQYLIIMARLSVCHEGTYWNLFTSN
jgi:hypothetical protein